MLFFCVLWNLKCGNNLLRCIALFRPYMATARHVVEASYIIKWIIRSRIKKIQTNARKSSQVWKKLHFSRHFNNVDPRIVLLERAYKKETQQCQLQLFRPTKRPSESSFLLSSFLRYWRLTWVPVSEKALTVETFSPTIIEWLKYERWKSGWKKRPRALRLFWSIRIQFFCRFNDIKVRHWNRCQAHTTTQQFQTNHFGFVANDRKIIQNEVVVFPSFRESFLVVFSCLFQKLHTVVQHETLANMNRSRNIRSRIRPQPWRVWFEASESDLDFAVAYTSG